MEMLLKSLNIKNRFKKLFVDGEMINIYTYSIVVFIFTFLWTLAWSLVAELNHSTLFILSAFFALFVGTCLFLIVKPKNNPNELNEESKNSGG